MEEARSSISSTQQVYALYAHNIPDDQKNVDFVMKHLNDPNFDLSRLPSPISVIEEQLTKRNFGEDSNDSMYFDEWALLYSSLYYIFESMP